MYAAGEVGIVLARQNGKGDVLLGKGLHSLYLTPVKLLLWSAHEFKTAREMFLRVRETIDGCYDLRKRVKAIRTSHGEESVELLDGSRLHFVARSTGAGRGFSPEELLWDEAFALTDEQVSAQMPSTAAQPNAQVWYASSHPLATSLVLRRLCRRGRGGDPGLAYMEWGSDKSLARDDRAGWAQANPGYPNRLTERSMRRLHGAMTAEDFDREMLGLVDLEDDLEHVIDPAAWERLADPMSRVKGGVAFAIDVNPDRTRSSIAVAGRRADGLGHVEVIEYGSGTGWVVPRVEQLKKWGPSAFALDPASPAGSLITDLGDIGICVKPEPHEIKLHLIGSREMAQACGSLFQGVVEGDGAFRHLDQPELEAAVKGAVKRPCGDAWAFDRKNASVDISPLVAVTEAWQAFAVYGDQEYDILQSVW